MRRPIAALALLVTAFAWNAPARAVDVQSVVSPGGIEAWLVEDHSIPVIAVSVSFKGSAALDPAGKEGLAYLAASTIDEGAGERDSQTFQGTLEDNAINLRFQGYLDSFRGTLKTLTENRDLAFELLGDALTRPRFDAEPVERIRSQILVALERQKEDPGNLADLAFRKLVYPDHPYGRPRKGTPSSMAAITADDLRGFVKDRLVRDRMTVGVVGDISPTELSALLDETFGDLPESGAPAALTEAQAVGGGQVAVVPRDVPQTTIMYGHQGIRRDDPDYYAAYVVNYSLGGGSFSSRLYEEVREKRGLAYSIYSYLSPFDHGALLLGAVGTANARAGESLSLVRQEWARLAAEGPTEAELEHAKRYLTGSFALRLTSSDSIANMLVGMQEEDLGIDYIDRRNSFIEAVTLEDARRVAAELFQPDKLAVVAIGRPEGIEPTVEITSENF